ncbi:MAG TPA: M20/M25/M40 family metallo-hydrolase [Solirubrobacteraceae bacterium]|nr:M20/M25/M40 family metallo-hydrolase [Solirubrobacteraceae bacterium]
MSLSVPSDLFNEQEMLEGIARWVEIDSPTHDADAVNRMMDAAAAVMYGLGAAITRHPGRQGLGDAVLARVGPDEPGILVLAHLDTVHPVGSAGERMRREDDRFFGPGAYDMKGGAFLAAYALGALLDDGQAPRLPVTFLFIPDEEIGSPTTRALIETEASRHHYVLVPEPAQDRGNLITGRWAFQRFVVEARGTPGHAGGAGERGASAIREIAAQIPAIESLSDPDRDITVSVGVVHGGTFVNVVPDQCQAEVLAVTATEEDFHGVRRRLRGLQPLSPGIQLEVRPGPVRPLFAPTTESLALYEKARALANRIGFNPGHGTVGGGSDGNFTGALGVPTLDGIGVCGDAFHTAQEHLLVSSLVPRARLIAELLRSLDAGPLQVAALRRWGRHASKSRPVNAAGTFAVTGRDEQSEIRGDEEHVDERFG